MSVRKIKVHNSVKVGRIQAWIDGYSLDPALHPGGTPRVTEGTEYVETEVKMKPAEFVTTNVVTVGDGDIVGNAVVLNMLSDPRRGI